MTSDEMTGAPGAAPVDDEQRRAQQTPMGPNDPANAQMTQAQPMGEGQPMDEAQPMAGREPMAERQPMPESQPLPESQARDEARPMAGSQPMTDAQPMAGNQPPRDAAGSGVDESPSALMTADQLQDAITRWRDIQGQFVDDPRHAVQQADSLVADLMERITRTFAEERQRVESRWSSGEDVSTEDLRQALQRYRSFFERLLAA